MKTMTKKMGAIVLALALCLSLCCSALAAETQTYSSSTDTSFTITVNPAYSGETYTAYKIFDVTYDDNENYAYTIDGDSAWYETVSESNLFTLTLISGTNTYVVVAKNGISEADIVAAFTKVPEGAVPAATASSEPAYNEDGSSTTTSVTLDVTNSGAGYYFVTTSVGSVVSIDTTNPAVTIRDKNTPPTLDKEVDDQKEESVDNHKTVTYTFDITNVKGIHSLVLEDEMEANEYVTYEFDYENMTVVLIDGTSQKSLIKDTDYTLVKTPETGDECDFHIVFEDEWDSCSSEAHILVTIDCELDAGEYGFEDDEIDIPNHAVVSYGNNSKSSPSDADVYEYGFDVYKYDGTTSVALPGAHFTLTKDGQTAYFAADGSTYVLEGWGDAPEGYTSDLVSDSTGYIKIEGLGEGTYTITETAVPDGYNMLTSPITVKITADENDPSIFYITVDGEENTGHTVNIANYSGTELPSTGGIGTTIFYIIGGVLVAGAVVVLITRRRMSSEG